MKSDEPSLISSKGALQSGMTEIEALESSCRNEVRLRLKMMRIGATDKKDESYDLF